MNKEIQRKALQNSLTLRAHEVLEQLGIDVPVSFDFSLRGKVAGQASSNFTLRFNLELAEKNLDTFLKETVPHECAHLAVFYFNGLGCKPHGAEWKSYMRLLGVEPRVTHSMNVTKARTLRTYKYQCSCRTVQLSSIRHNKVLKKTVQYKCTFCGKSFTKV